MPELTNSSEAFDRNVYILGAGFSAAAGAPLLNNFLDVSAGLWEDPDTGLSEDQRLDFEKVFEFRRRVANSREKVRIDLDNVEHLFGLIDMAERLSLVAPETSHAILTLISTTLDCTSRRFGLPEIGVKPPRDIPNHISEIAARYRESRFSDVVEYRIDIYSHFAALIGGLFDRPEKQRRCRDTVITFNYDLVLDRAFEQMGIDFGYGLNIDQSDASGPDVTFLKLHGSINWKTCPTCEGVKITSAIDSKNALSNCSDCGQRLSPLLVPPSWDKASSGIHGARQLASQWRAAAEALTSATRICIIGYSVPETDAFFRYLLTLGLAENPRLNILLVIDPSGQVGQKFDNLLDPIFVQRRFQFLQEPFEQALGKRELYQLLRRGNESIADINNYGTPIML